MKSPAPDGVIRASLFLGYGGRPTKRTLKHKKWLAMPPEGAGVVVHDVHRQDD